MSRIHRLFAAVAAAAFASFSQAADLTIAYQTGIDPVSYTHLDVYKRQARR